MAVGLLCLCVDGAGVGADACAAADGHYRMGQIKPPVGLYCDDLVGVQSFPATRGIHVAEPAGLRRADRNFAVFYPNSIGRVA